jgi:hypothetical protein
MRTSPKRQPLRQASTQSCGLALCAAALLGGDAEGSTTILYTDTGDVTLHFNTASKGTPPAISFDPDHTVGTAPDYATAYGLVDLSYDYFFSGGDLFTQTASHTVSLDFLTADQEIGSALSYAPSMSFLSSDFYNIVPIAEDAYVGLAYFDGADYYYGWVRFNRASEYEATLKDFAMEQTPNTSILAGAVPEPGSIILTFGGLGLATLRRRVVR